MQELIDIYDSDRNLTGLTVEREGAFMQPGQFMLYVLALIQDEHGRFLITRRALDKHWAAGWWEVTGGGARAGETSLEALRREVREEVGLDMGQANPELVYSYCNIDAHGGDNYFADIYRLQLDFSLGDVVLQEEEAIDCRLVELDEIDALNEQGIFLHYKRLHQALENLR